MAVIGAAFGRIETIDRAYASGTRFGRPTAAQPAVCPSSMGEGRPEAALGARMSTPLRASGSDIGEDAESGGPNRCWPRSVRAARHSEMDLGADARQEPFGCAAEDPNVAERRVEQSP